MILKSILAAQRGSNEYLALETLVNKCDKFVALAHFEVKYITESGLTKESSGSIIVSTFVDPIWSVECYIIEHGLGKKDKVWRILKIKVTVTTQRGSTPVTYSEEYEQTKFFSTT